MKIAHKLAFIVLAICLIGFLAVRTFSQRHEAILSNSSTLSPGRTITVGGNHSRVHAPLPNNSSNSVALPLSKKHSSKTGLPGYLSQGNQLASPNAPPISKRPASPTKSKEKSSLAPLQPENIDSPAALVWIDGLTQEQDAGIQHLAEEFKQTLENLPQQTPASDYNQSYDDAAKLNDSRFKARYGAELWRRHHIAAYHLKLRAAQEPE